MGIRMNWVMLPAALAALTMAAPAPAATILSEKEVKERIATAHHAADHIRIADYYREEAARQEAMARVYEKQARNHTPAPAESKQPLAPRTAAHHRQLAQLAYKKAYEAREQAALHEDLAREAAGL